MSKLSVVRSQPGQNVRPNRIVAHRYFTDEPDPDLLRCRDWLRSTDETFTMIAVKAQLNVQTLVRIEDGRTHKPMNATVRKLGEAFGFRRVWMKVEE